MPLEVKVCQGIQLLVPLLLAVSGACSEHWTRAGSSGRSAGTAMLLSKTRSSWPFPPPPPSPTTRLHRLPLEWIQQNEATVRAQMEFLNSTLPIQFVLYRLAIYTYTHAHSHTRTHTCTHICTHTHIHMCTRTCAHARTHAYTHTHTHTCTHEALETEHEKWRQGQESLSFLSWDAVNNANSGFGSQVAVTSQLRKTTLRHS